MKPSVLVAAPAGVGRKIAGMLRERFAVVTATEAERAEVLVAHGDFRVVVSVPGFVRDPDRRFHVIADPADDPALVEKVARAIAARKAGEPDEARRLASLAVLPYEDFMELVRDRHSRRYLLALMSRHEGSVTAAARAAGVMRESLHRLLRRHDIDADAFRPSK